MKQNIPIYIACCNGTRCEDDWRGARALRRDQSSLTSQSNFQDDKALFSDLICAGLGRKEEALRLGRRACERVPISKDAKDGIDLAIKLAQIYAWTGEKDLAIEQIEMIQRVPNPLSYRLYSNSIPTGIRSAVIRASKKS
jgi:hypothetical protein